MIDYSKVSDNPEVIRLIKEREKIEKKIRDLDIGAILQYELEVLNLK